MGQYYHVINVDKKEQMLPFDYDNGLKIMEFCYNQNPMVLALMDLMANEWKGDRVYVIGDYADLEDMKEVWAPTLENLMAEIDTVDLYDYSGEFPRVLPDAMLPRHPIPEADGWAKRSATVGYTRDRGYRFIYNHATRQVIDLNKCPIEWVKFNRDTRRAEELTISPLVLLLAMGNGRGGGDYSGDKNELVGSWVATSGSIEIRKEPVDSWSDYEDFRPDFTELKHKVPYTELTSVLREKIEIEDAKNNKRELPEVKHPEIYW